MAADGKWNVTLNSPMGAQQVTIDLTDNGGDLSGSMQSPMGAMDITEGRAEGDSLTWKVAMTQPMPMTLEFSATVAGDSISGEAKMGSFGSAPFTGSRA